MNPHFLRVDSVADLERAKAQGAIGILIGQQNSVHFRTVDDVDRFYNVGPARLAVDLQRQQDQAVDLATRKIQV